MQGERPAVVAERHLAVVRELARSAKCDVAPKLRYVADGRDNRVGGRRRALGFDVERHPVGTVRIVDHEPGTQYFRMALDDGGNLRRMDKHPLHLRRLVGSPEPTLDPRVGPATRARTGKKRGKIPGSKADQRVDGVVKRRHDDLADFAGSYGISGAGPQELNQDTLVHDESGACFGFVGDRSQIGARIDLVTRDAPRRERIAQARRKRFGRHERFAERGERNAELVGLLEDDLEERRCPDVPIRREIGDRLHLQLGLSCPGGKHGAPQCERSRFKHRAGRREMVGECVVDQVAGAKARSKKCARKAPMVREPAFRLVDRAW